MKLSEALSAGAGYGLQSVDGPEPNARRCQSAPEELGDRLRHLAVKLAGSRSPRRIRYGSAALEFLKRQSPEGFLLESDHGYLQLLLPDGRLWSYSRTAHGDLTAGRYFYAPVDYVHFVTSRLCVNGIDFAYLGATLGKYSFGIANHDQQHRLPPSGSLCALTSSGSIQLVSPGVAFAEIADGLQVRNPSASWARDLIPSLR